ncbi:MAG: peptidoglycan DD-metalloendopeptidase family protein [Dysgonamonadaceae bacterium]|nr:peptidoglycan DD-metalloendopeptidase family protein [Dysgonamonadaceae bacterium]
MNRICLLIPLLWIAIGAQAQDSQKIKDLKSQREHAVAEIQAVSKLLDENKKSTTSALNRLNLLVKKINARKELIRLLNREIETADREVNTMSFHIRSLEKELNVKKQAYAASLRKMYLHKINRNELFFLFSAQNLMQTYRRILYLKEYAAWKRRQSEEIIEKQQTLEQKKQELLKVKAEKTALLAEREAEEKALQGEQSSQKKAVQSLKTTQKQLEADLKKKRKRAEALNNAIKEAIAEEIRKAEKDKSPDQAKDDRMAESKGGYAMTKEERLLSDNFANNRGLLPFPVKGDHTVVAGFGIHQFQELKNVMVHNNGIDIQTTPGNEACSVFNGVVTKIFLLAGFNNNIIVRHGNYLTVYSNLVNVRVKQGESVKTGQALGTIFTDTANGNETILHFELWKEKNKLNPENWLRYD